MTCKSKNLNACDGAVIVPIRPSKIKMTIIMIVFVYPIVTLLLYALNPLTDSWAVWHRTLVLTPLTVSLIVFVVSPLIAKYFDSFLRPRSEPCFTQTVAVVSAGGQHEAEWTAEAAQDPENRFDEHPVVPPR